MERFPTDVNSPDFWEALQNALDVAVVGEGAMSAREYMLVYTALKSCQSSLSHDVPGSVGANPGRGGRLYDWLVSYISQAMRNMSLTAHEYRGEELLGFYLKQWEHFQSVHLMIGRLFSVVDEQWIERQRQHTPSYTIVSSTLVQLWFIHMFRCLTKHLMANVISLLDKEREGGVIDSTLITNLYKACVELKPEGMSDIHVAFREDLGAYIRYYEQPYIDAAIRYIAKKTSGMRSRESMRMYLGVLHEQFVQEDQRSENYLRPDSLDLLRNKLNAQFLVRKLNGIYLVADTMFAAGDDQDGLRIVYALLSRFADPNVLERFLNMYVKCAKKDIKAHCPSSPKELGGNMSEFMQGAVSYLAGKFDEHLNIIKTLFQSNPAFVSALKKEFSSVINSPAMITQLGHQPSRLAAEYCNFMLKSSKSRTDSAAIDQTQAVENELRKAMNVFYASSNKDVFFSYYELHLMYRLIGNKSVSLDLEKTATSIIYQTAMQSANDYASRDSSSCETPSNLALSFEGKASQFSANTKQMISDSTVSHETSREYSSLYSQAEFDTHFKVLRDRLWQRIGRTADAELVLHPLLIKACGDYKEYYLKQHPSRALKWQWSHSKATVQLYFPESKGKYAKTGYTFVLNAYQVTILNMFIDPLLSEADAVLSPAMICTGTRIDPGQATEELDTLAKAGLLMRSADSHEFWLNQTFSSKRRHIDISKVKSAQIKRQEEETNTSIRINRQYQLHSDISGLMKKRECIEHTELFNAVKAKRQNFFVVDMHDFKCAIDKVIYLGIIERDESDQNIYRHCSELK
ncbi:ubiquitin ligase (cullin) of SCF [Coemansia erecta]|nr:ubiquitin ligase (cullin) of SCF [Coemansia sp. RSA 2618]KAJ2825183.1 ubiquitin ligase (cullin) of SCF [Coemansia erecta]